MNKKAYLKPEMQVVLIQHTGMLMISADSAYRNVDDQWSRDC